MKAAEATARAAEAKAQAAKEQADIALKAAAWKWTSIAGAAATGALFAARAIGWIHF